MTSILAELGLVTQGDEHAWAVTSPDDRYRYILGRTWHTPNPDAPLWLYCMINPSKARHDVDDHTMTKCCGFARRHLARGILIVNLFAYSATDPKDMIAAHGRGVDVRGEHNTAAMLWALTVRRNNGCDRAVPLRGVSFPEIETGVTHLTVGRNIAAWGRVPPSLRMSALNSSQLFSHHSPDCFGTNADGSPKHPLMLAYDTQLVRYIP